MSAAGEKDFPVLAGRWQFDRGDKLGSGPNAETFGGVDLETGNEIVVKLFRSDAGQRGRERFLRESQLHEQLDDETILPLLDAGTDSLSGDFIVTRRLRPGSLWTVSEGRFPLGTSEALAIGTRVAKALSYMHGRREIHGDISPGNVLLDANGVAYLADFGFSKRIASLPLASSGDKAGTTGFMAPREPGTPRTEADDVFSLAAVLWFCLTGKPPSTIAPLRRRELRSRALRTPLEQVLDWDPERTPGADRFGKSLQASWANATEDWRQAASRRRRSFSGVAVAGALALIGVAGVAGRLLASQPPGENLAAVARHGVELHLPGEWQRRQPPDLSDFDLRQPVAVGRGRTTVVAGRAPSAGADLLSVQARSALPEGARRPTAVIIGGRGALRYGPAIRFGGAVEVLTLPLERDALVIRCSGPVGQLSSICARAVREVELDDGAIRPLAPDPSLARVLMVAVRRFDRGRRQFHHRLAASTAPAQAAFAARELGRLEEGFAAQLEAVETNAQDRPAIEATARGARRAAASYMALAEVTAAEWSAARAAVLLREAKLERSVRRLGRLRVYAKSRGGGSPS